VSDSKEATEMEDILDTEGTTCEFGKPIIYRSQKKYPSKTKKEKSPKLGSQISSNHPKNTPG